ncbi:MAG: lipocalin family protein [Candidatus Coprenecus sp.]
MKRNLFRVLTGLFLGVLSVMSLSSCSKEEMNEKNIIGKWQSSSITTKVYEAGKLVSDRTVNCVDFYLAFNFKSDGTGQYIMYEEGESSTIQINWVLMGDKLMISAGETLTFDVISISGSLMVLEMTEEYTDNGIKHKYVDTINFKKI